MFRTGKMVEEKQLKGKKKNIKGSCKPKQMHLSNQVSSLLRTEILYGFVLLVILPIF